MTPCVVARSFLGMRSLWEGSSARLALGRLGSLLSLCGRGVVRGHKPHLVLPWDVVSSTLVVALWATHALGRDQDASSVNL